jgi:PAS domain S-box-containing protein
MQPSPLSTPADLPQAQPPRGWAVDPGQRQPLASGLALTAACALLLLAFATVPALQFELEHGANLAVHTVLELASITVCCMVFALGWATFERERESIVPLVSAVFLAAGVLDAVHMLSFTGMPHLVTPSGTGKAISTFVAARMLVALAMLAVACVPRPVAFAPRLRWLLLGASLLLALGVSWVALSDRALADLFFVPGQGLTRLKVGLEFVVIGLHLAAAAALVARLRRPGALPVAHLLCANLLMALSEFCFTLYTNTYDQYINVGHVIKVAAYALVWRAMFGDALLRPYQALAQARAELAANEERYRLVFEHDGDGIFLGDRGGLLRDANQAACRLLGVRLQELRGRPGSDFIDATDPRLPLLLLERERTGRARGPLRLRRGDGSTFEAEVSTVAYRDAGGRPLASWSFHDLTELLSAQEEIRRLDATLEERVRERTAQLETVNRDLEAFSYSIAHDLRSPLASIEGFGAVLAERLGPQLGERELHYLERIRASAVRMSGMVDGLLVLAGLARSTPQPQALDLVPLVREALEALQALEPQRAVRLALPDHLPARGDERLLRVLLDNLLGNAWKFSAGRDEVVIEVGLEPQPDGGAAYFVRDHGAGFDAEAAQRLGSPFQRFHGQGEFPGHGIGLATVARIVALHGGRLWARSRPGEGATLLFTLAR